MLLVEVLQVGAAGQWVRGPVRSLVQFDGYARGAHLVVHSVVEVAVTVDVGRRGLVL